MSSKSFRFVHTSDLHLEQPLHGVSDVPDHLVDLFLDAPFRSAELVFDAAIRERVDAVIIAGDFIQPRTAGPRGLDFVLRQFRRLQEKEISVYWARGQFDDFDHWPAAIPFPSNVHLFLDEHVESVTVRHGKQPIAVIQGRAANSDMTFMCHEFDGDPSLPTIATVYGRAKEGQSFEPSDIDYWALGGVHSTPSVPAGGPAYYGGSPQGRRPEEEGPHGCRLVEIDSQGNVDQQFIATDVARWHVVRIDMPDSLDQLGLLRLLRARTHAMLAESGGRPLLLHWIMTDSDESSDTQSDLLAAKLREGGLSDEILESLRHEFGTGVPVVWHFEIDVEPPTTSPTGWYEEDTVLGDLLRCIQRFQNDPTELFPLETLPEDHRLPTEWVTLLKSMAPENRAMQLRRVAALGVDLLRGDRVLSEEFAAPRKRSSAVSGL